MTMSVLCGFGCGSDVSHWTTAQAAAPGSTHSSSSSAIATLYILRIRMWKTGKMRRTLNGNQCAVLLIGIGATKWGVIKGYTKQRQERRLSVSKHVILEDDELSEHAESAGRSGKEIASMLCNMPHEQLLEVVQNCPASMLQQFMRNVAAPVTPAVVSIPAVSCG